MVQQQLPAAGRGDQEDLDLTLGDDHQALRRVTRQEEGLAGTEGAPNGPVGEGLDVLVRQPREQRAAGQDVEV